MSGHQTLIVLDFGSQVTQLIARRVRELGVFAEILPYHTSVEKLRARDPRAIILSGGPSSLYDGGAPQLDPAVLDLGVPVLGICYGLYLVLMIINQKRYPILDSRVIRNWKIFFKKNPFPDIPVINNPSIKDNKAMVKNYIEYQKAIQMFAKGAGRSLRDIEFLFYYAGKKSFR